MYVYIYVLRRLVVDLEACFNGRQNVFPCGKNSNDSFGFVFQVNLWTIHLGKYRFIVVKLSQRNLVQSLPARPHCCMGRGN